MEEYNKLNLFWGCVFGLILICAIVSIFWKLAIYSVIASSAYLCGVFIFDYIRIKRMK